MMGTICSASKSLLFTLEFILVAWIVRNFTHYIKDLLKTDVRRDPGA